MRQRAVQNHVHGIVQVRFLGESLQRLALGAFDGKGGRITHCLILRTKLPLMSWLASAMIPAGRTGLKPNTSRSMFTSMNTTLKQLAQEALHLTPAQRAELADFLVESLHSVQPDELQHFWIAEANKRLAEIRSGKVKTIPGEEVLAEARRLVKR